MQSFIHLDNVITLIKVISLLRIPFLLPLEYLRFKWDSMKLMELLSALFRKNSWKLDQVWTDDTVRTTQEIGDIGEDLAALHLKNEGYKILYRNFLPLRGGEIDLVCRKGHILIFIEVKTLRNPKERRPLLAIDKKKREQLKKGAQQYIQLLQKDEDNKYPATFKELSIPLRFDAVEVELHTGEIPAVRIIEDLSMASDNSTS